MPKGRLLILEDDPGVGRIVRLIARSIGMDGHFTTDAEEFLTVADEWQPSHIALDLSIPETDVEEVLVAMAQRGCSAHIIIISGMGERVLDAARRTARRIGLNIVGVLAKPFSIGALREMLEDPSARPPALMVEAVVGSQIESRGHRRAG